MPNDVIPNDLMQEMIDAGAAIDLSNNQKGGEESGGTPEITPVTPLSEGQPAVKQVPSEPDYSALSSGRYKSKDEFEAAFKRLNDIGSFTEDDLNGFKDFKTKQTELQNLNQKLEDLKKQNLTNPLYYKLQHIEEKNPELAPIMQKYLLGKADDKELVKLSILEKNPTLSDDKVDRLFARKFGILTDVDADTESDDYKDALLDLEVEAMSFRKKLDQISNDIVVPTLESLQQEELAKNNTLASQWKPQIELLANSMSKFDVDIDGLKVLTMDIPPQELASYIETTSRLVLSSGMTPSEATIGEFKQAVQNLYVQNHWKEIAVSLANNIAESIGLDWRKSVSFPSTAAANGGGRQQNPAIVNNPVTLVDDWFNRQG